MYSTTRSVLKIIQSVKMGQSNENKYMEFLADLDSLGSKLMKKDKKWPSTYVK